LAEKTTSLASDLWIGLPPWPRAAPSALVAAGDALARDGTSLCEADDKGLAFHQLIRYA
jgi:hypothetical protein